MLEFLGATSVCSFMDRLSGLSPYLPVKTHLDPFKVKMLFRAHWPADYGCHAPALQAWARVSHLRALCEPRVFAGFAPRTWCVSVQTQDLASNTQKVPLPLGAFVVESG